jgi:hypothetical protein
MNWRDLMSEVLSVSSPASDSSKKDMAFRGSVVISGASRGLGAELVAQACDLGYFVFAMVRGSAPSNTSNICFVSVNLSSEESIEKVVRKRIYRAPRHFHLTPAFRRVPTSYLIQKLNEFGSL